VINVYSRHKFIADILDLKKAEKIVKMNEDTTSLLLHDSWKELTTFI
jgi:hypothetical protein